VALFRVTYSVRTRNDGIPPDCFATNTATAQRNYRYKILHISPQKIFFAILITVICKGADKGLSVQTKKEKNMVIMPVSGIDAGSKANKYTSFGHRRSDNNDIPAVPERRGSNNLAKVPVVVLMAMSPAMINAGQPRTNIETEAPAKTEMVAAPSKLDTEALDELTAAYPRVEALQQSDDGRSVVMRNKDFADFHKIVSIEGFISGGQKKYMVFANFENEDPNTVWLVNMVPKNNKNTERPLPYVRELIYHDLGSAKKNFCSVKICYDPGKNANGGYGWLIKDERIPDEIANKLVELLTGRSGYINKTSIRFSTTNSAALQPDKKVSRLY